MGLTTRYMCVGCGEERNEESAQIGFHTRAEHDPGCPGGGFFCDTHCPVPVQCGPIEEAEED